MKTLTDYDLLKALGEIFEPKCSWQAIKYQGKLYEVRHQYDRYQVYLDGLLIGNI